MGSDHENGTEMTLLSVLRRYNARHETQKEPEMLRKIRRDSEVTCEFEEIMEARAEQRRNQHASFSAIPSLLKGPKTRGVAGKLISKLSTTQQLKEKQLSLPNESELQ